MLSRFAAWIVVVTALAVGGCLQERTVSVGGGSDGAGGDPGVDAPFDADDDPSDALDAVDSGPDVPADVPESDRDAEVGFDAGADADAGEDTPSDALADESDGLGPVLCSVGGVPGECLDVADCTGDRAPTPGHCPGPAAIQCCTPNEGEACDPAAMPLPNAGLEEAPGVGDCPDGMVPVEDFCIDQYEAALLEVLSDGSTRSWSPYHNPGTRRMRAVSLAGAVPQGYITGVQAADACDEAEKRLCSDTEWRRACRGVAGTNDYPYGPSQVTGWCNENRALHPAVEYFGTSADWIWAQLGNACINQLPASLAPTGDYVECVSADDVYDLVGNLHEWTADPNGTFRGGYYVDTWRNGLGCNYATTAHNTQHWDYSTGFRCCY